MIRGVDHIGVGCAFICHDGAGNLLMHRRSARCRDEQGRWDFGAGSMEFGESFEETVRREVEEEYGARALELRQLCVRNSLREHEGARTHWVHVVFLVRVDPAEARNNEPEKIDEICWFRPDRLPDPLHSAVRDHLAILANVL